LGPYAFREEICCSNTFSHPASRRSLLCSSEFWPFVDMS
jgi:hypothetical protein